MTTQKKVGLSFNHFIIPLEYGFANGMQKEYNRADDGTVLSEKHTFNIRGAIVARKDAAYDRYANLVIELNQQYINLDLEAGLVDRLWGLRGGPLVLAEMQSDETGKYTLIPDKTQLQYKYAQLININIAEAPEDTAGIHFQELTMSFEAIVGPADNSDAFRDDYRLKAATESFEIKKEEDKVSYFVFDTALPGSSGKIIADKDNPYYSYTITHTLSAQGLPIYFDPIAPTGYTSTQVKTVPPEGQKLSVASETFYEAYKYVNAKKKDSLVNAVINTDAFGRSYLGSSTFIPVGWTVGADITAAGNTQVTDSIVRNVDTINSLIKRPPSTANGSTGEITEVSQSGAIISNLLYQSGAYKEYNVVRTSTVDMMGGSYSLTTTYFYSRSPATMEINGSYEKSEDGNDTVRVNGTITGLDSNGVISDKSNKYKNARFVLEQICKKGLGSDESNTITSHDPVIKSDKARDISIGFNEISSVKTINEPAQPTPPNFNKNDTYRLGTSGIPSIPEGLNATGISSKVLSPWGVGTNIFRFANTIFEDNKYSMFYEDNMVLDVRPISTTVTENKLMGTIQFDATYKAVPFELRKLKLSLPNCLAVTVSIQDDNRFRRFGPSGVTGSGIRTAQVIPVMVMGRTQGPILQSMSTTKQSERKVQLEATLDVAQRYPNNDHCIESGIAAVLTYAPSGAIGSKIETKSYLTELTNSWDWANGKLTVNAGWIYTQ